MDFFQYNLLFLLIFKQPRLITFLLVSVPDIYGSRMHKLR